LHTKSQHFINHLFDDTRKEVESIRDTRLIILSRCFSLLKILYPSSSVRDLAIWSNLYLHDICQTPAGSSEHPSTFIPARMRSYDDLSNSFVNGLHRSTSDPGLNLPSQIETVNIHSLNHLSINQQLTSTRLHTSLSTSSLLNSSHPLDTCNGSSTHNFPVQIHPHPHQHQYQYQHFPHQTALTINLHADNRIKPHCSIIDDSAPDITQLALSFQRYPLNMNSIDSILRTMSRPRKHTTSTSSTASSLSEAWSMTRINTYDHYQTQRMVCHT
jgi:hypothetical protein